MYKVRFILKPGMQKDTLLNTPAVIYGHSSQDETVLELTFASEADYERQLETNLEEHYSAWTWNAVEGLYTFPEINLHLAYSIGVESDE